MNLPAPPAIDANRTAPRLRLAVRRLLLGTLLLGSACAQQQAASPVAEPQSAATQSSAATPAERALEQLWQQWNDPAVQRVEPFQIFDNLYYIGIDWVAAYLLVTDAGLVVIDSLYGPWTERLLDNVVALGFKPADIRYALITHGHFDHAGGAARLQSEFGTRIVMSEQGWDLVEQAPSDARFAMPAPRRDIVGGDGDVLTVGEAAITLLATPGHTHGVLSYRYRVLDRGQPFEAITLGGVGRNFSGVDLAQAYVNSYEQLLAQTTEVSVSLPNHAAMGAVFERAQRLADRAASAPHPFVDGPGYRAALQNFLAAGREKLRNERDGTARSAVEELSDTLGSPP